MRAVAGGRADDAEYATYLSCQWRLHAPLERTLSSWLNDDWARGRWVKASWLARDLQALGRSLPDKTADTPTVASRDEAMGIAYVLEGATLGLRSVVRTLPDAHPAHRGAGRFMAAYGEHTGRRWSEFVRVLEAAPPEGWPMACHAATATFAAFHLVFEDAQACPIAM